MAANARRRAPSRRKPPSAALRHYRKKRDFSVTPEPSGTDARPTAGHSFVIQKHAASHLHYDFRLEMDGVLKSWAVAKGPSLDPSVRRLAIETEDHPLAYGSFEGTIPKGQYGGGTVMVWDSGIWQPLSENPRRDYTDGHLKFRLDGQKLHGQWALVRMKPRPKDRHANWLLIKDKDDAARPGDADRLLGEEDHSAKTGRDMDAIAHGKDVWHSNPGDAGRTNKAREKLMPKKVRKTSTAPIRMPAFIPPELATRVDHPPDQDYWLHEIKFDGYRLHVRIDAGKVRFLTRRGQDWTGLFKALAPPLTALPCKSAYIDAEAVVLGEHGISDFGALQATLKGGSAQIVLYAFDLLFLDGNDLRERALLERKVLLKELLRKNRSPLLHYSDHQQGNGTAFFKAASAMKVEGIISKDGRSTYESNRTREWLKVKRIERQEFVIVGFQRSTVDQRAIGSLLLGERDGAKFTYVGKVGTGYTASSAKALHAQLTRLRRDTPPIAKIPREAQRNAVWVEPKLVAEIEFGAWTKDHILRHAAFIALREDKAASEVKPEVVLPVSEVAGKARKKSGKAGGGTIDTNRPMVRDIGISHPDRLIYPNDKRTKLDVARYYDKIADVMMPHISARPLALVRCPDGIGPACFFQKHIGVGMHKAIHEKAIKGDKILYVDSSQGLVGLVQYGVLEIHVWGSHITTVECPDWLVFDFDPDPSVTWDRVAKAAVDMRKFLTGLGLKSFLKTTGGKGLHVVVPVRPVLEWENAKAFTRSVAATFAEQRPEDFTTNMSKKLRTGRIFIDYLRNGRGATAIAPYSTRARPGGFIATPISWDELEAGAKPKDFTLESVVERVSRRFKDPWSQIDKTKQSITAKMIEQLKTK